MHKVSNAINYGWTNNAQSNNALQQLYQLKSKMQPSEFQASQVKTPGEFKELPRRWLIIVIYALQTVFNSIASKNVPPIATKLQEVYGVSALFINAVPMAYLLIYAIINIPANYFLDSHGLRTGLLIGSLLFTIGTIIELFVNYNFAFLVIGSVFVAISQPFILNCPAKIATFWFFSNNRPLVTSVLALISTIGGGIGILLPTIFISEDSTGALAQSQLWNCLVTECALSVVGLVLIYLFMTDRPELSVSYGSETQKTPFKESLMQLLQNKNFVMIFLGFVFFNGPLTTLASVLNFLFKPYNYQNIQISIFGIGILVFGIIGAVIFSTLVARTLQYSLFSKIVTGLSMILLGLIMMALKIYNNFYVLLILLSAAGFFVMPVSPISYDWGCETAFPVGQAQITGTLNGAGALASFLLILIIQTTIGFGTQQQTYTIFICFLSLMVFGMVCYWFVINDLKRRKKEDEHNEGKNKSEIQRQNSAGKLINSSSIYPANNPNNGITVDALTIL